VSLSFTFYKIFYFFVLFCFDNKLKKHNWNQNMKNAKYNQQQNEEEEEEQEQE